MLRETAQQNPSWITIQNNLIKMREWRNWQTRTFEGRVVHTVRVQVPFLAPSIKDRATLCPLLRYMIIQRPLWHLCHSLFRNARDKEAYISRL